MERAAKERQTLVGPRQSLPGQLGRWTGHSPAVTSVPRFQNMVNWRDQIMISDHDILGTLPCGEILVIDDVSPFFRQRT
jgi:hypothetical protein